MKRYLILITCLIIYSVTYAQSPQSFQYQAVVRDAGGNVLVNQPVSFQISIIYGALPGSIEYVETHTSTTNAFGIVTLTVGNGTPVTNLFSDINWSITPHFIKVEADLGSGYLDMGTTQLLSVPYALYSENAGNIPTYSGGTGINVTGTIITNTSPDQTVILNNGTGVNVTGAYPSFTINNSSPNATHTGDVTGSGALTIANNAVTTAKILDGNVTSSKLNSMSATNGQVLKFNGTNWAPAIDLNAGNPGGLDKTVQFNNSGSFGGDTAMIWDNTNKRLGVGLTNPNGRVVIRGSATALQTEPLFEVKNSSGQTVFVVYPDSVHVYVKDGGSKSNQGGFAVSGRSNSKAFTNNFLTVTPDSTRIFTGDTISGFGVENLGTASSTSYMRLTPFNYFIGHQAGNSITNGRYNSFIGYQSGLLNSTGYKNYFIGYRSGYNNSSGYSNIFIGDSAGYSNTTGMRNVFIGNQSGLNNISGNFNVFLGYNSGFTNNANFNVFIGYNSGYFNNSGIENVATGYQSLYYNTSGNDNVANGYQALLHNSIGNCNVAIGFQSLNENTQGCWNVATGFQALLHNTTASYNTATGYQALRDNVSGSANSAYGQWASAGNTIGNGNAAFGYNTLSNNSIGYDNSAMGYSALSLSQTGNYNVAHGCVALGKNISGNNNSSIGSYSIYNNTTGSNNSALGYYAFYNGTAYANSTALGANAAITQSNKVRIGDATVTVIEGQVAYSWPSDGRFKNNVTEEVKGLDFITKLRPIVYNFDTRKFDLFLMQDMSDSLREAIMSKKDYSESTNIRQTGFIAQEVEQAAKESGYNFNGVHKPVNEGDNYSVAYSLFTVPLVKAVQELNAKNEMLSIENEDIKKEIKEQRILIVKLLNRIEIIENKLK